jgi:hypothetical protein
MARKVKSGLILCQQKTQNKSESDFKKKWEKVFFNKILFLEKIIGDVSKV